MADIIVSPIGTLPSPTIDAGTMAVGAAYSIKTITSVINAAWNQGIAKQADMEAKVAALGTRLDNIGTPTVSAGTVSAGTVVAPGVVEPGVTIPATASTSDILNSFDSKYVELVNMLSDRFAVFRTTYFPNEHASYAAAEAWLQAALANPSGLPPAVAAALLGDAEAGILVDSARASDAVLQTFAARGFPLPPGAAAGLVLQIQQKAQTEMADARRKLIIASIEQFRFVVQQTLNLRQMAMTAAVQYIQALASAPDIATKVIGLGYDAQSKLISAASQFYNCRIQAAELAARTGQFNAELASKAGQFNATLALQAAEKNQAAELTLVEDRLKALLAEIQAIAQMATSLFNNVHASAGTSYSFGMK